MRNNIVNNLLDGDLQGNIFSVGCCVVIVCTLRRAVPKLSARSEPLNIRPLNTKLSGRVVGFM